MRMEDVNDHRKLSSESHRPGSISERLMNQRISFLNDNGLLFPLCIAAASFLTHLPGSLDPASQGPRKPILQG